MKVLITTGIFPPDIGGPARIIEQLATDLRQKDLDVTVLAFGRSDDKARSFSVFKTQSKMFFSWYLLKLAMGTDVIYACDLYTAGFLSWLIGKKILSKKLVVRFAGDSAWESALNKGATHDDILMFQSKKYSWSVEIFKLVRSWIMKDADHVVAVSGFMKDLAIKISVPTDKITVIYNSVDFAENRKVNVDARQKLGLSSEEKIIMTSGRLVPWKGVDGLIKAVAELNLADCSIVVIGDGPEKNNLEKLALKLLLAGKVIFAGRIPMDEVLAYYRLADVFVLNSQYEGLSHVLLEALSVGVPVIASNCGGNSEVIENEKNGLLVEYNNINQINLAIKRILTEEKWHTVEYKKICQESLKKFNWQKEVEQTIEVFNQTLKHAQSFINQSTI